jgi:methanogenic corrinoid protein MtbC1
MLDHVVNAYREAILDTDRDAALRAVHNGLQEGLSAEDIVFRVVIPTIEVMLQSVSEGLGASLGQHFMTAQISAEVVEEMVPKFETATNPVGHVVLGTSHGDFHGLGKRIVGGYLKAQMIAVTDLGLNVPARRFVDAAVEAGAQVIGISSMMVHTARGEQGCLKVRAILRERGLEQKIKVIVGGAPYRFDENLYLLVGADAWAENAMAAGKVVTELIREVNGQ